MQETGQFQLHVNHARVKVAEAAGLKHVALPEFEDHGDSAWSGSLKKTNKNRQAAQGELVIDWLL